MANWRNGITRKWKKKSLIPVISISLTVCRKLRGEWHGGFQGAGLPGRPVHRPLGQDLQQRRGEALRPPSEETTGAPPQSSRGGVLLRGHDRPRSPDGHEETGGVRGVPPHRQVWTRSCLHSSHGREHPPPTLPLWMARNQLERAGRLRDAPLSSWCACHHGNQERIRPHTNSAE